MQDIGIWPIRVPLFLTFSLLNQPLQCNIDVHLIFGRNGITRYFSVGNGLQVSMKRMHISKKIAGGHKWLAERTRKTYKISINSSTFKALGKSFLLPRTRTGMFDSCGFSNKLFSSVRAASILSWSAASTTNLKDSRMLVTPYQMRHISQ